MIVKAILLITGLLLVSSADIAEVDQTEVNCQNLDRKCPEVLTGDTCIAGYVRDQDGCLTCECKSIATDQDVFFGYLTLTGQQAQSVQKGHAPEEGTPSARAGTAVKLIWNNEKTRNGFYRIPYYYNKNYVGEEDKIEIVQRAITALYAQTCIKFSPAKKGDTSIVEFKNTRGCSSFIGREPNSIRTVYRCSTVGSVLRHLMHILGFWPETMRWDRDDYVTIVFHNIIQEYYGHFRKLTQAEWNSFNVSYDIASITHYGGYQFTAYGGPTVFEDPTINPVRPNNLALSAGDLKQIKRMYNCSGLRGVQKATTCYYLRDYGIGYRGEVNVTETGIPCKNWRNRRVSYRDASPVRQTASGLANNYCRNPDMKDRPWCYISDTNSTWEYCNITVCNTSKTRLRSPDPWQVKRGFWGPWSNYSICSKTCGPGYLHRTRRCIGAEPGSEACPGDYYEYVACNYTACPPVEWDPWQPWSECNEACGNGTQTRVRHCDGRYGTGNCTGEFIAMQNCSIKSCPQYLGGDCFNKSSIYSYRGTIAVDIKGNTCLNWTDTATSPLDYPDEDLVDNYCRNPQGAGKKRPFCHNKVARTNPCPVPTCNLVATWSLWDGWSCCSTTCGPGVMTRTRRCRRGSYGDGSCFGDTVQTMFCNLTCGEPPAPSLPPPPTTNPFPATTTPSRDDCVDFKNPRSYRGYTSRTKSGYECQYWDSITPWAHPYTDPELIASAGLQQNYCRTPNLNDTIPWCFVDRLIPRREDCSIPTCQYIWQE